MALGSCTDCSRSCTDDAGTFDGLFDLETDPREEHNVIALYPEVIIVNPTRTYRGIGVDFIGFVFLL